MNDGVWVTYTVHFGGGRYNDIEVDKYSNLAFFDDELEALRFGNGKGCRTVFVPFGYTLQAAITAKGELATGKNK